MKNKGWNADIQPGQSVTIGFGANYFEYISAPTSYSIPTDNSDVKEEDYSIDFKVVSDWGQAFNGELSITNNAEEAIEDWTLEFDFERNIERFWTAEIVECKNGHYIIKNAGYNANIEPGQTIILGFSGNPGNVGSQPKNYVLNHLGQIIDYEKDTDGDGLTDVFEKRLGTDPNKIDTDNDDLTDYYEYFTLGTDPLKQDTDGNGIDDGKEDFDIDGITNLEEYRLDTNPYNDDTDCDDLTDYDEVNIHETDPLKLDTDNDRLEDGDEIILGFDPLNPDTNNNSILDGDEKLYQVVEQTILQEDKPEITKVSVAFKGNGNIHKTTSITNMYNIDILSSEVVGLVGVPVEINTTSKFDKATITFEYDESKLEDIPEENLCIMWYDEENEWYQILDQESVVDTLNNTISVETTHFSTYLVVDRQEWYKVWNQNLDYRTPPSNSTTIGYYDIALVLDSSGSMGGTPITNAKHAARSFVEAMYLNDRMGVITFNNTATTIIDLTSAKTDEEKEKLKAIINNKIYANGGTNTNSGLNRALEMLDDTGNNKKIIILLCDGDVADPTTVIQKAKENEIKIYTINFGSSGTAQLTKIAKETGGEYYYAKESNQLMEAFYNIQGKTYAEIDTTDTDGDKLPDVFEIVGMQLINGKIVTSDPTKKYSDSDRDTDYEEMGDYKLVANYLGSGKIGYKVIFKGKSDPRKADSDGDEINDDIDVERLKVNTIETMFKLSNKNEETNPVYVKIERNKVTIVAHIAFTGDTNDIFPGTNKTYVEMAVEGIEKKWRKDSSDPIIGTDYDFVPGLKGELVTNVIYKTSDQDHLDRVGQKYFRIHIDNSEPTFLDSTLIGREFFCAHIPHMNGGWSVTEPGRIFMYKRDQRNATPYTDFVYEAVVAHEFGHILGLKDAYPEANGGKKIVSNAEIAYGKTYGVDGSIMCRNGLVYSNDVEMMLEAFRTNKCQYPIDKGFHKKSRVVRLPQVFE